MKPTLHKESVMLISGWMLLWLKEGIKVPEGALNEIIGGHFGETEEGNKVSIKY